MPLEKTGAEQPHKSFPAWTCCLVATISFAIAYFSTRPAWSWLFLVVLGFAILFSIDQRRRSAAREKRLREENEIRRSMYESLLDATEDHVFMLDRNLRFEYANRATVEAIRAGLAAFGKDPHQQIIGKSNRELGYSGELLRGFESDIQKALAGETAKHEMRHPSPIGIRSFECVLSPVFNPRGKIVGVTGFTRDVTDRQIVEEAELKLGETVERMELALRAGKIGVYEMDLKQPNIPVQWSERQYEIFEVDPQMGPLSYQDFERCIHPDDLARLQREFQDSVKEKRDFNLIYRARMGDGRIKWIQGSGRTYYGLHGEPVRMVGTNIDVTETVEAQQASDRALRAREETLAVVSHDLRNPLGSVLMNAALIKRKASSDDTFTINHASKIQLAGQRMNDMIEDLLNLAKMDAGNFTLAKREICGCDIVTEAVEILSTQANEKNIRIETFGISQPLQMSCDHIQVLRVLSNLIGNAIKFTPEYGLIRVGAEDRDGEVLFSVSDTGPGIAEHHLAHVFDRFWQVAKTQHMGAGLGLAISKGIVEAHGGRIWVTSRFGEGTQFFFTLPKVSSIQKKSSEVA